MIIKIYFYENFFKLGVNNMRIISDVYINWKLLEIHLNALSTIRLAFIIVVSPLYYHCMVSQQYNQTYQQLTMHFRLIGYQSLVFNSFLDTITLGSCLLIF